MIQIKNTLLLILSLVCMVFTSAKEVHPYHVGSLELNYNSKSKTYEITGRFFIDDLENALNKKYNTRVRFHEEKHKQMLHELLGKYCDEYLKIKSNNQILTIQFIGYEEDKEAVNIYLESQVVPQPKKVEVSVSLLYNFFDDQMNIIHIIIDKFRKSGKLVFPNRYLYHTFQ